MIYAKRAILQLKNNRHSIGFSLLGALLLLFFVTLISSHYNIKVENFTRDPNVVLKGHPFIGAISNLGILFWCAASVISFFAATILLKKNINKKFFFMLFSGLITFILLMDDLFMLHEEIFPKMFNISEKIVYSSYLAMMAVYFIIFRYEIIKSDFSVLFLACGFFALSIGADVILPQKGIQFLIEDGFKLFGIIIWLVFFAKTSYKLVIESFNADIITEDKLTPNIGSQLTTIPLKKVI